MSVSKNPVFADIFATKAMSVIHFKAEEALVTANPEDKERLKKIVDCNNLDSIWVIAAKAMGRNLEVERIKAFQDKKAAEKKAAGIPERKLKTAAKATDVAYLFDTDKVALPLNGEGLSQERQGFWMQKHMRQTCWMAAIDTVNDYSETAKPFLISCQKEVDGALNQKSLDTLEFSHLGSKVTNGPFPLRKQFWKFVGYRLDGVLPRDLANIIDISSAMWNEYLDGYRKADGATQLLMDQAQGQRDESRSAAFYKELDAKSLVAA